ncbi:MAG: Rieske (2Fe-2S) protein [Pseudorhodoplanes sp.]|uniref:Rieske (2Fe-2S) protein n=1 Tax=Pseudorhodoplanes sp. TaxID=1934341 RepID=UPI003D11B614
MPEMLVGRAADFSDNSVLIVTSGETEVGVFRRGKDFYAYENLCLHQGGPVCEGMRSPRVDDVIAPDRTLAGQRFIQDDIHIVCPWHGYEYKLTNGECIGNPKLRLRKFEVRQREGNIYVVL